MDDCEFVTLITATACAISRCCSEDEIALLAAGLTQLGDTLATLMAQQEIRERKVIAKNQDKNDKDKRVNDKEDIGEENNDKKDNDKKDIDKKDIDINLDDINMKETCRQIIDENSPDYIQ